MPNSGVALRVSQLRKKQLVAIIGALIRGVHSGDFHRNLGAGQSVVEIPFRLFAKALHGHFQTLIDFPLPTEAEVFTGDETIVLAVTSDGVAVRKRGEKREGKKAKTL